MNIKEAIVFELTYNFITDEATTMAVINLAALDLDLSEDALGSNIDFYEMVDELLYEITK